MKKKYIWVGILGVLILAFIINGYYKKSFDKFKIAIKVFPQTFQNIVINIKEIEEKYNLDKIVIYNNIGGSGYGYQYKKDNTQKHIIEHHEMKIEIKSIKKYLKIAKLFDFTTIISENGVIEFISYIQKEGSLYSAGVVYSTIEDENVIIEYLGGRSEVKSFEKLEENWYYYKHVDGVDDWYEIKKEERQKRNKKYLIGIGIFFCFIFTIKVIITKNK